MVSLDEAMHKSDNFGKLRKINQLQRRKNRHLNIPVCEKSGSAIVDLIILIAVIVACGVLLYPYAEFLVMELIAFSAPILIIIKDELIQAPMLYLYLVLSTILASFAIIAITYYSISKFCGKPGCKGLRKAAEFDIELQTEDWVNSLECTENNAVKKGLFEYPLEQHLELEAELRKLAPPNGRAVLVFRARCGCSVGLMEVPGPKRPRKLKK